MLVFGEFFSKKRFDVIFLQFALCMKKVISDFERPMVFDLRWISLNVHAKSTAWNNL